MSTFVRAAWYGKPISAGLRAKAVDALLSGAEYLLEEANRDVPIEEGTLQASGQTSVDAARLESCVSYDTPYAIRLHEHPEYHFQHGRKGKWLEDALKEHGPEIAKYIQSQLADSFGGTGASGSTSSRFGRMRSAYKGVSLSRLVLEMGMAVRSGGLTAIEGAAIIALESL